MGRRLPARSGSGSAEGRLTQALPATRSAPRSPKWIAGITLLVCGYGFQAVALAFGPVALVQPVVVTELAIAVPIAMWRRHRRAALRDWIGIVTVLGGVAGFLALASPVEGIGNPNTLSWIATLVPVVGVVALLVALAAQATGRSRAMLLGAAAGAAFGLLAVLTNSMPFMFIAGIEPLFAVLVGGTALDEQVRLSGAYLAGDALTAAVASVGIRDAELS